MSATEYQHKPTIIRVIQWTGGNERELIDFTHGRFAPIDPEDRIEDPDETGQLFTEEHGVWVGLHLGQCVAKFGDGDYQAISAATLAEDYEAVTEEPTP